MNLRERPYLEVEVVEVKKGKRKEYIPKRCRGCSESNKGCKGMATEIIRENNGNWVNGENINKIEFPCACTYVLWGERKPGMLTSGVPKIELEYILHSIDKQCDCSAEDRSNSLIELMEKWDIHIEKAKIVIFKEIK